MNDSTKFETIKIRGEHAIDLTRDRLWECLNDPTILKRSIKGCQEVRKESPTEYHADFRFSIGPIKKSFTAVLNVGETCPPQNYQLSSTLDGGVVGTAYGSADVFLDEISEQQSGLRYVAQIRVEGALAHMGARLLGNTAQKYMQRFFDNLVAEINAMT